MRDALSLVLSVEVFPPKRQAFRPGTRIMNGKIGQRPLHPGGRRGRALIDDHDRPMSPEGHVHRQLQVDPAPAALGDDDIGLDRLHTPSAYWMPGNKKSPAPGREPARGEERELKEIVGVIGLQDGSNSRTPSHLL